MGKKRETKFTPRARGNAPASKSSKITHSAPSKQVAKRSREKSTLVSVNNDLFAGAKRIEFTKNSISVTHARSKTKKGAYEQSESRRYMERTPETMAAASTAIEKGRIKKIRIEFE